MQTKVQIEIERSLEEVWDFFTNVRNMGKWVKGFVRFEAIDGQPWRPGAKGRHYYVENGEEIILEEEVVDLRPMQALELVLSHTSMTARLVHAFEPAGPGRTRLVTETEYRMNGMYKLMGPVLKQQFQSRQEEDLARLKKVLEGDPGQD